jgi:hypothetical protein
MSMPELALSVPDHSLSPFDCVLFCPSLEQHEESLILDPNSAQEYEYPRLAGPVFGP